MLPCATVPIKSLCYAMLSFPPIIPCSAKRKVPKFQARPLSLAGPDAVVVRREGKRERTQGTSLTLSSLASSTSAAGIVKVGWLSFYR